jgi:hypothetical protein
MAVSISSPPRKRTVEHAQDGSAFGVVEAALVRPLALPVIVASEVDVLAPEWGKILEQTGIDAEHVLS